jgi:hypothetical protein
MVCKYNILYWLVQSKSNKQHHKVNINLFFDYRIIRLGRLIGIKSYEGNILYQ